MGVAALTLLNAYSYLPYVITGYGLPHTMGYIATRSGERRERHWTPLELIQLAETEKVAGIEIPLTSAVPSFDGTTAHLADSDLDIASELTRRGMRLVADYGALLDHDADHLLAYLSLASKTGANVVRATLSHILCGDRRHIPGGWQSHLEALTKRVREVAPAARDLGVCLAVENHQDADTDDLLRMAEAVNEEEAFGITLDTGNPLAVGQDPVEAARRLAPVIRHLHLKDYTIHHAPEGYRLVRCAAGDGVVDFAAILRTVLSVGANSVKILPGIEIAAQATRTIPIYDYGWWDGFPGREARELAPVVQTLSKHGRPQEETYSSAWERGEDSDSVAKEEVATLRRSIAYFRTLDIDFAPV